MVKQLPFGKSLAPIIESSIQNDELTLKVSDLLTADGKWDLHRLCTSIPEAIKWRICSMPISRFGQGEDKFIWQLSDSGIYSVCSAYRLLKNSDQDAVADWTWLWSTKGPEKMKVLLWLACRGRMHTRQLRFKSGLTESDSCPLFE